jgi:hypothetical protein
MLLANECVFVCSTDRNKYDWFCLYLELYYAGLLCTVSSTEIGLRKLACNWKFGR